MEFAMPLVSVRLVKGSFSREQQVTILKDVTDAIVKTCGEAVRPSVVVWIEELEDGLWARGGEVLTIAEIRARRAAGAAVQGRDE
jgi:4-oxalocrotonate tautomerase